MKPLVTAIRAEVERVAKRQIKAAVAPLRKQTTALRSEIAALKRALADSKKELKQSRRGKPAQAPVSQVPAPTKAVRWSHERFSAWRKKKDISARTIAKAIGVSEQSIYNWESGKVRPRAAQINAVASLKPLSKKKLEALVAE